MNFNAIPVSPWEDEAFNELSTAVDRVCTVAASTRTPGARSLLTDDPRGQSSSETSEPRTACMPAGPETTGVESVSRKTLADSPVVPVLGIWALYAWMFYLALEAVR